MVIVCGSVQKLITVKTFSQNLYCLSQNSRVWILVFFSSSITNRLNTFFLNMSYACTEKTENILYFKAQNQKEIESGIKILPFSNLKMETNIPCKFFNKAFSSKKFFYIFYIKFSTDINFLRNCLRKKSKKFLSYRFRLTFFAILIFLT